MEHPDSGCPAIACVSSIVGAISIQSQTGQSPWPITDNSQNGGWSEWGTS